MVDTYGTGEGVRTTSSPSSCATHFKLTPRGIIEELDLRRPIYTKTAAFGHFGRTEPDSPGSDERAEDLKRRPRSGAAGR